MLTIGLEKNVCVFSKGEKNMEKGVFPCSSKLKREQSDLFSECHKEPV
jgi:hypothetical protein